MKKNKYTWQTYAHASRYIVVWVMLVVVGLAWLLIFITQPNLPSGYPAVGSDAWEYATLGQHLIDYFQFSRDSMPPFTPEVFRTPGYPAFVALGVMLFGSTVGAVILQIVVWAAALLGIYFVAQKIVSKKIAAGLLLFFALYPAGWYLAIVTLSDLLFTSGLVLLIFLIVQKKHNSIMGLCAIGGLLGVLILIRPAALLVPGVLLVWLFFQKSFSLKKYVVYGSAMLIATIILVAPWVVRNYVQTGYATISSVSEYNLGWYNAALYKARVDGSDIGSARDAIRAHVPLQSDVALHTYPNAAALGMFGREYISDNFFGYTVFHAIKTIPFFISDSFRSGLHFIDFRYSGEDSTESINFGALILGGEFGALFDTMKIFFITKDAAGIIWFFGTIFWGVVTVLVFVHPVISFMKQYPKRQLLLLFWLIIMYFAAITGPVASARYRFPVEFLMLILAMHSIVLIQKSKYI